MKKQTVINHFGGVRATALAFNLSTQAVYAWTDPIPEARALRAEKLSKGKLKYSERVYL